jgi:hypothetical protein
MPVSKVTLPLLESPLTRLQGENNDHFLASVELGTKNVVGGYIHMEHDACILLLLNHGRLNRIFEQAGVAYCPRPEPGSEASKEAARKRKNDAVAGPVGKQTKVPDKKKVDAPKASMTSKTAGVASSKADFAPTRVALKPGVHGCGESCFPCSSSCTKAGVLRISTRVKRPESMEPSTVHARK